MMRRGNPRLLRELAEALDLRLIGDGGVVVSGVASIESASPQDLIFVENEKHLAAALRSQAGAVVAGEFAVSGSSARPLLIGQHPKLAFARAAQLLYEQPASSAGLSGEMVHPTAVIHTTATLGAGVSVAERAVVGEGARVGAKTRIEAGAVIGAQVNIGCDCVIYPNVTIYSGTSLGDRVIVHAGAVLGSDGFGYVRERKTGHYEKFPQVGRLVIEDDVEIGANATVDRGALDETRIRRGTKVDNLVHVGHNCDIGEDVVIAAQTGISGSVVIENGVVCGGQVGLGDHVRIGEGVVLGSQGGVLPHKILRGTGVVFWGTPARPLREYLRQLAVLARLGKKE